MSSHAQRLSSHDVLSECNVCDLTRVTDNMCCHVVTCVTVALRSPEYRLCVVHVHLACRMTLCDGQNFGLKEEHLM